MPMIFSITTIAKSYSSKNAKNEKPPSPVNHHHHHHHHHHRRQTFKMENLRPLWIFLRRLNLCSRLVACSSRNAACSWGWWWWWWWCWWWQWWWWWWESGLDLFVSFGTSWAAGVCCSQLKCKKTSSSSSSPPSQFSLSSSSSSSLSLSLSSWLHMWSEWLLSTYK